MEQPGLRLLQAGYVQDGAEPAVGLDYLLVVLHLALEKWFLPLGRRRTVSNCGKRKRGKMEVGFLLAPLSRAEKRAEVGLALISPPHRTHY